MSWRQTRVPDLFGGQTWRFGLDRPDGLKLNMKLLLLFGQVHSLMVFDFVGPWSNCLERAFHIDVGTKNLMSLFSDPLTGWRLASLSESGRLSFTLGVFLYISKACKSGG